MRFAIYARKSTEGEDRQVQSLDDQIRELRNLASREGYLVVEVFQESRSAKTPGKRPEFDRLLSEVEDGRIDGVLTWAINRLSRNPVDGGRIAYLLQTGQLSKIRTIERTYLPDDNALLLSIENGMATAYIQDLSRNVKRGMRGKFERGWQNGKAPLGYKNDPESKEIVPDPERFELVRSGWQMLLSGDYSTSEVVTHLQSSGLTTHSRLSERGIVSSSTIYNMFRKPFYCGRINLNEEEREGKHRPMVTVEEFARVQQLLSNQKRPSKARRGLFPFQGILKCAKCGCTVLGERKCKSYRYTNRTVEYVYYHCSGAKGCRKSGMREEAIVEACRGLSDDVSISEVFEQWLRREFAIEIERRFQCDMTHQSSTEAVEREQLRLDALVTMRADGEIGFDEFARGRAEVLSRIHQLQSEDMAEQQRPFSLLEKVAHILNAERLLRQSRNLDVESCAQLMRALGGGLFQPGTIRFHLFPVLKTITELEPHFLGSETARNNDLLALNPIWQRKLQELLNLIDETVMQ